MAVEPLFPPVEERSLPLSKRGDLFLTIEADDEAGDPTVWPDDTTGFIEFSVDDVDTRHPLTLDASLILRAHVESDDLDLIPRKGATWRIVIQNALTEGSDQVLYEGPVTRGAYG